MNPSIIHRLLQSDITIAYKLWLNVVPLNFFHPKTQEINHDKAVHRIRQHEDEVMLHRLPHRP